MLDLQSFRWLGGERVWMGLALDQGQLEVVIGGNENRMDELRLALAGEVVDDAATVERLGSEYLDSFVDRAKFSAGGKWSLSSLEFGRQESDQFNEFTAYFMLDDDVYGLWSVQFRQQERFGISPFQFSRQQN